MEEPSEDSFSASRALEQFREEWRAEVSARTKRVDRPSGSQPRPTRVPKTNDPKAEKLSTRVVQRHPATDIKVETGNDSAPRAKSEESSKLIQRIVGFDLGGVDDDEFSAGASVVEPESALEHFERAVEKESQGNLGDSLSHYRKAYKLDAKVDQKYKNKHFPQQPHPLNTNPSNAPITIPSTAHHSSKDPIVPLTFGQLVESFSSTRITGIDPVIPGDKQPPCPMADLPSEVLLDLLEHTAIMDPATFARLGQVCKNLAYHVHAQNKIWRRVALGPEFGLASQRYYFATDLQGREVIFQPLDDEFDDISHRPITELCFPKETNWRDFFQTYPRIRFCGVYISTVNYVRPGGASATQAVWSNPIHVVTYYRYLRFFKDGTCISLLTVNEPIEVVHHLTPENLTLARSNRKEPNHPLNFTSSAAALLPTTKDGQNNSLPPSAQNIMKHALRGRWKLYHPAIIEEQPDATTTATSATNPTTNTSNNPNEHPSMTIGDILIETEGAGPRYMYTMHLTMKSTSRSRTATKNNKLLWKGFWYYNSLTDDWAEFSLRNDKQFYFSRVKSYGLGY